MLWSLKSVWIAAAGIVVVMDAWVVAWEWH